jgi:3-oxoacyl-[acyl-carrier protein] reductase
MNELDGRVVIVTGASRGLGRTIALELSRQGAKVVAGYTSATAEAQSLVEEAAGPVCLVQGDISEEKNAAALTATALKEFGRVDVLINNAGIARDQLLVRMSAEDWDAVMNVNLKGAFLCTKYALKPMMRQRYGKIINISSISGVLGNYGQANYAASKAGLIGLAFAVAQEYSAYGIRGVALAPGLIDTGLGLAAPEAVQKDKISRILLGYGTSQQVAATAAFLASAASDFINATVVRMDGGWKF